MEISMLGEYIITENIYQSKRTDALRAVGQPVILKVRSGLLSEELETGLVYEYELPED